MFFKLINQIKLGFLYKKKYVKIYLNKTDLQLVEILIKLNIIKYIKQNKGSFNEYYVHLCYFDERPAFQNIKNLYKPSKFFFISLKDLTVFQKKKNYILLISTSKGVMTSHEAVKNSIGGVIIAKISN